MRILYVVHQFYPEFGSGTERVTLNLARMAQRAGHHVQVLGCLLDRSQHRGVAVPGLADALTYMVDGMASTWRNACGTLRILSCADRSAAALHAS